MSIGDYRHVVTVENPGVATPDGDGGYTQTWAELNPPTWHCRIQPATARDLERVSAGTVLSTVSHILTGRHHSGITTQTRITFGTRTFSVTGVSNPEERGIETIALCTEVVL